MKAFFKDKFNYNHHSNIQVIDLLDKNPQIYNDKIAILASHTLDAHHIWNHRIYEVLPAITVWQELNLEHLRNIDTENLKHSLELLESRDLEAKITYTNSQGRKYTDSIGDIFYHIINHSTYHRGQLMSLIKNSGITPISTDYIFYKR